MSKLDRENSLYHQISELLRTARKNVLQSVNITMTKTYFKIGKLIVEEEQNGKQRAVYGEKLITELSKELTEEYGKGFSTTNLKQMRTFYLTYSKGQTLSDEFKLSWSHYLMLMRIDNPAERNFYEIEALENNWSLRELQRQFDSALYERLALSREKSEIRKLSEKGLVIEKAQDSLKDPYVLEFLGLPEEKKDIQKQN